MARKKAGRRGCRPDMVSLRELQLYAENDSTLYRHRRSVEKNAVTKMAQGKYDAKKAPKLWGYHVEQAAKKYAKDFGGRWNEHFDKCTRDALARRWAREFRSAALEGDYDKSDVPKKYRGKGLKGLGRTSVKCRTVTRGGRRVTVCRAGRAPSSTRRRRRRKA